MSFSSQQFASLANVTLQAISAKNPIDQITKEKPFLDYLIGGKNEVPYAQGVYREKLVIANDSNYQNYFGRDQVTYNSRDPNRLTTVEYANFHDGFGFDEDELAGAGIVLTDSTEAVATGAEKFILVNKLTEAHNALQRGALEQLDLELHRDGSQSTKAVKGLDHLVQGDPTASSTVLGWNQQTYTWWRNQVSANINTSTTDMIAEMQKVERSCKLWGASDMVCFAGSAFIDAYAAKVRTTSYGQPMITISPDRKNGVNLDGAYSGLSFNGMPIVWDPTLDDLHSIDGSNTYKWNKRCYFLSRRFGPKLRPYAGRWMVKRQPERMPDRYFYYFGLTSSYGMSASKRRANAHISIL